MEHAAPEAFWVDKTKCSHTDENGRIQNPTLNPCAEAISAVKAIAIAQSEGQKIYTINKQNAQTALQKLPIGGEVGSEIRNAVNAGKEVTVHEKSINKHGWKRFGYIVIDPETGAGSYLIEGGGNGGEMTEIEYNNTVAGLVSFGLAFAIFLGIGAGPVSIITFGILLISSLRSYIDTINTQLEADSSKQREMKIATISILTAFSNLIKPLAAAENPGFKMIGWLTSMLSFFFSTINKYLPGLLSRE